MMLEEHYDYLSTRNRHRFFERAVAATVRPGDVVADLGCGTGVLGLMCLRAGAARTYEIESGPIIEVARESFRRLGFLDRAVFLRGTSNRLALPEKVDALICDHIGYFGIDYGILGMIEDARNRFLKPGGAIIPSKLRLLLAPVTSRRAIAPVVKWRDRKISQDYHWISELAGHQKHAAKLDSTNLLSDPQVVTTLDLHADAAPTLVLEARFEAERAGPLHGLAGWFEAELAPGVVMTNAPDGRSAIARPQAFFPIDPPVDLEAGERMTASLVIRPSEHSFNWDIRLPGRKLQIRRSTFDGELLDPDWHRRADPAYTPQASPQALARRTVLGYCDGTRTRQQIIDVVLKTHPDLMPSQEELTAFVVQVIENDTR